MAKLISINNLHTEPLAEGRNKGKLFCAAATTQATLKKGDENIYAPQ